MDNPRPTRDSYALKMDKQRKGSVEITPCDPQFIARYVGKTEVFLASGKGCTRVPVQRIWDNFFDEKDMLRVSLLVNSSGITMKGIENSLALEVDIKDIAYCSAESGIHAKVFAWICKDPMTSKLLCHAVLCNSREVAQQMAMTLHSFFHVAYKDWKQERERRDRTRRHNSKDVLKNSNHKDINGVQNGTRGSTRNGSQESTSQDSGSISGDSNGSNDGPNPFIETIMAQMNIVEEEEISLMERIMVEPK